MKIIKILSSVALFLLATETKATTLNDTLISAYQKNYDLAAKREQLKGIDEKIFEANSGFLPQLMFKSSYQEQKNKTGYAFENTEKFDKWVKSRAQSNSLSLQQNLFSGGSTILAIEKAKYVINQGREDLKLTESKILGEAASAHFEIIFAKKILDSSKKNQLAIKRIFQVTKEKFETGIGTRTHVAMAQQSYANAVKSVIEAEGRYATALSSFTKITGIDGSGVQDPEEIMAPAAMLEEAIDKAYQKNPNFIAAKNQFYAADTEIKEIIAQMMPSLDLNIESSRQKSKTIERFESTKKGLSNSVVFQLTVPLYRGGKEYSAIRKARSSASASKLNLNSVVAAIKDAVSKSWYSYETAKAAVEAAKESVSASKIALEGANQEFDEGIMAITDLLDVQLKKLQSELGLFDAQKNLALAAFAVKSLMGELTAKEMNLPVEYFDLEKNYNKIKFKLM